MESRDTSAGGPGRWRRARGAGDPRRFPGLFFTHVLLILVLLAIACTALALRTISQRPARAATMEEARAVRGASFTGDRTGMGPLSAPPTRPKSLDAQLAARGTPLPEGALVYAVRVIEGPEGRIYEQYQAGRGALATDFWPASSIKVLAALGALDFARSLGYSGAATVTFDGGGPSRTLRSIYEPAIRDSSNHDYDLLVQMAGIDRLNAEFLTSRNGFPATSITRSYAGTKFDASPAMILEEGDRRTYVPERKVTKDPECRAGNCSNLFEMTESVRRIVLDDHLPPEQRFDLHPTDLEALSTALVDAQGFLDDAVKAALGAGARTWSKPGDTLEHECLDVTFVESRAGKRFLLAAAVPHRSGGCDALARLATGVLKLLSA